MTRSVIHIMGCCFESSEPRASHRTTTPSLLQKMPPNELDVRVSKQPCARSDYCGQGRCSEWPAACKDERIMSEDLENAGQLGPGRKEKKWTDCVWQMLVACFGNTRGWSTTPLDLGAWYDIVCEGRFVGLWPHGRGKRKRRPKIGSGRKRREIQTMFEGRTWGDRKKFTVSR